MSDTAELRVTVNGERQTLPLAATVAEVLARFEIDVRHVAVERNRKLVPKSEFDTTKLEDGDVLEVVTFVGGG